MTEKEIEKELSKIYKERKRWTIKNKKLNNILSEDDVERRQEILYLQQILYKIKDTKKEGDKNKEYFNLALYYLTKFASV